MPADFQAMEVEAWEHPVDLGAIRHILGHRSSGELRCLVGHAYEKLAGSSHAFTRALREHPYANYYRLDSAPAILYRFSDPERPLIVHLKDFKDEAEFRRYCGCGPQEFAAAVGEGLLLPTVHEAKNYQSPFMRDEVFPRLRRLGPDRWPVYANVIQAAQKASGETDRINAPGAMGGRLEKLAGDCPWMTQKMPLPILETTSALDPVVPLNYLRERFEWFSLVLPRNGWKVLERLLQEAESSKRRGPTSEECRQAIQDLVQAAFVFYYVFGAAVYYSRGPSVRVSQRDIQHWISVLRASGEPFEVQLKRLQRHAQAARLAGQVFGHAEGLAEAVRSHVPGLAAADAALHQAIPRCLGSQKTQHLLDSWEKVLDEQEKRREQLEIRERIQSKFVTAGVNGVDVAAVEGLRLELGETLKQCLELPGWLFLGGSERARAIVDAGGTMASLALPSTKPLWKALDLAWRTGNLVARRRIPAGVLRQVNPAFQLSLDFLQVPPEEWWGPGARQAEVSVVPKVAAQPAAPRPESTPSAVAKP